VSSVRMRGMRGTVCQEWFARCLTCLAFFMRILSYPAPLCPTTMALGVPRLLRRRCRALYAFLYCTFSLLYHCVI